MSSSQFSPQIERFQAHGAVAEPGAVLAFPSPAPVDRTAALRKRFAAHGACALNDHQTLELLLPQASLAGRSHAAVSGALLARFGSLPAVFGATLAELALVVGGELAIDLKLLHDLSLKVLASPLHHRDVLSSTTAVTAYLRAALGGKSREAFHVLFLDKANQLILDERMGEGTVDHAPVYAREVMRRALEVAASSCCLAHNHPTGGATPSGADIEMTRRVVEAGRALGVVVHDHFLVAGDQVVSFKSLGLM